MRNLRHICQGMALGAGILASPSAFACASCYGAPDAPMTKGMNMAIFFMLGTTGCVFFGLAAFVVSLKRRKEFNR